jgi:hypothetical protein
MSERRHRERERERDLEKEEERETHTETQHRSGGRAQIYTWNVSTNMLILHLKTILSDLDV